MIFRFSYNSDCLITYPLRKWIYKTIVFFVFAISLGCGDKAKPNISICGSTTANPIMKMASAKYMQENDVFLTLRAKGSKEGIRALIEGSCNIATSSSKITPALKEEAELKGIDVKEFIFAYDSIVPVIHPSNPVRDLRIDQLREIFTGSIKSWSEVGGTSHKILVVHRDISSGTREVWERVVINPGKVPKYHVFQHSNSEVLAYVAKHPSAIGYISHGYINNEIKTISINGVKPTLEKADSRKYPIHRNLYLYVNEKKFSYEVKTFIIYLISSEGQEIVKESGFIPLYPLSLKK